MKKGDLVRYVDIAETDGTFNLVLMLDDVQSNYYSMNNRICLVLNVDSELSLLEVQFVDTGSIIEVSTKNVELVKQASI